MEPTISDADMEGAVSISDADMTDAVELPEQPPAGPEVAQMWNERNQGVVRQVGKLQTPVPVEPSLGERVERAGAKAIEASKEQDWSSLGGPVLKAGLDAAQAVKSELLDPLVIRPLNKAMADVYENTQAGAAVRAYGTFQLMQLGLEPKKANLLADFAMRQGGTLLMGDTLSNWDENKKRQAINALIDVTDTVDKLTGQRALYELTGAKMLAPEVSSAFAQSLLDQLGKLPLMFLPVPGLTPALREVMSASGLGAKAVASKAGAAALMGASENVLGDALIEGADLKESAKYGALIGGGLGGAAAKLADVKLNKLLDADLEKSMRELPTDKAQITRSDVVSEPTRDFQPPPFTPEGQRYREVQVMGVLAKEHRWEAGEQLLTMAKEGKVDTPFVRVEVLENGKRNMYDIAIDNAGNVTKQLNNSPRSRKDAVSVLSKDGTGVGRQRKVSKTFEDEWRRYVDNERYFVEDGFVKDANGLVIVGPDGAAKLVDVDSDIIQRQILKHTRVVEVSVGGEKKLGTVLHLPGEKVAIAPLEGHTNSVPGVIELDNAKVKVTKDTGNFTDAQLDEMVRNIVSAQGGNHLPPSHTPAVPAPPGAPPPVPPQHLAPPPAPPPSPRSVPASVGVTSNVVKTFKPGILQTLARTILPPHMWGDPEMGRFVVGAKASENLAEFGPRYAEFLERQFKLPAGRRQELSKSLYRMANGELSEADIGQMFPEVSKQAELTAQTVRMMLNNNHRKILALGGELRDAPDLDLSENVVTIVKRHYYKHIMGGDANAKRVTRNKALFDKAAKEMEDTYFKDNRAMSPEMKKEMSRAMVDAIIGAPNMASALERFRGQPGFRSAESSFKRRADLRPIVDLLVQEWNGSPGYGPYLDILQKAKKSGVDIKPIAKQMLPALDAAGITGKFYKDILNLSEADELSKTMRELLGELDDGFWAIGTTLAHQQAKIAELSMWQLLAQSKNTAFDGAYTRDADFVAREHEQFGRGKWVYLDDNYKHIVGNAAGGWVREDWWELMKQTQELQQKQIGAMRKFFVLQRMGMTALSPAAAWTQLFSNTFSMMLSGGYNLLNNPKALFTIKDAWQDFHKFRKSPITDDAGVNLFKRAVELGVTTSHFGADEGKILRNEFMNTQVKRATLGHVATPEDLAEQGYRFAASKGLKATAALTAAYQIADPAMKYATWRALLAQGGVTVRDGKVVVDRDAASKFIDKSWSPGINDFTLIDFVQREAARRVAASFVTFNMLSPAQKAVGSSAGVVGDLFVTSFLEGMRVVGQVPQRLAQGESGFASNLLQWMMVTGGAVAGMLAMRRTNGITEAMEEDARARLSPSDRDYHPFATAVPMTDAKGNVIFVDVASRFLQVLSSLNGYEKLGITKAFIGSWLQQLFGGVVPDQLGFQKLLASYGFALDPIEPKLDKAQYDGWQWINGLIQQGIPSTGLRALAKTARQAGWTDSPPSPYQGQYTNGVGIFNALTGNAAMVPLSTDNARKLAQIKESNAIRELDKAKALPENKSTGLFSIDREASIKRAEDARKQAQSDKRKF